jgi:flagellar biosynthetic protein FliR
MALAVVRMSGIFVFAPLLSTSAFPIRAKAVLVGAMVWLLAPLVASAPGAHASISLAAILGELGIGLVYGLTLSLLNEMLLFAGQIVGLQFSFSLVNLMDPTSTIQTPLMGELFQIMGILVMIAAGLDRILLASVMRSFHVIPVGSFSLAPVTALGIVHAAGGIFLAALELAAPVLATTMLIEVAVALMSKLSPQLPVMSLTVPMKTVVGFVVLIGSLAVWPRFIEARFDSLLDMAERLLSASVGKG